MKNYTDLGQSKKLLEFLPFESADAYWDLQQGGYILITCKLGYYINDSEVPCWSLAALFDVLPNKLQIVLAINDFQGDRKEKYVIGSVENDKYDCYADNPVDACYEMILRLYDQNLL